MKSTVFANDTPYGLTNYLETSDKEREGGVWGFEDFLEVKAIGGWEA